MTTDGHYQIACTRLFEMTHKNEKGEKVSVETIDHPNMWFEMSHEGVFTKSVKKETVVVGSGVPSTKLKVEGDVDMLDSTFNEDENAVMSMMLMDAQITDLSTNQNEEDTMMMVDTAEMVWFAFELLLIHSKPMLMHAL